MMGRSSEGMVGGLVLADRQQRAVLQEIPSLQRIHGPSLPWCKLDFVDTIVFLGQNTFHLHNNTWMKSNIEDAT